MITYKITTVFDCDQANLFAALFPGKQHDASSVSGNIATYSFSDESVTPTDLGPLVKVEEVKL